MALVEEVGRAVEVAAEAAVEAGVRPGDHTHWVWLDGKIVGLITADGKFRPLHTRTALSICDLKRLVKLLECWRECGEKRGKTNRGTS